MPFSGDQGDYLIHQRPVLFAPIFNDEAGMAPTRPLL
jgi:hypothetical protein